MPDTLKSSIDKLRDLAVMSRDYLQIGALEFSLGLDFLHGGRNAEAVDYFEAARRQWFFIDHLPLISLAYFAAGMAHQEEGDYRQAAAAYFKVMQCLQEAGAEPYRLEKIESERSLQAFWNDLERWLKLAVNRLRRDFSEEQDEMLRGELGDIPGKKGTGPDEQQGEPEALTKVTLQMKTAGSMSADDVDGLIFKTVDGIELLSAALTPAATDQEWPRPVINRLTSDRNQITIEIDDVAKHTVNLIRWLVTSISPVEPSEAGLPESDKGSATWFRWQARPGYMAEIVKKFVQSATGRILDEAAIDQLMQAIGHLAELRLNCHLTVI